MIKLDKYYLFSAEDVAAVESGKNSTGDYQYRITVHLKNGTRFSVNYADENTRDAAMRRIGREIELEKRCDIEKLHQMLYILQGTVNRMDKRQLRIWKQLKSLLNLKGDCDEGETNNGDD